MLPECPCKVCTSTTGRAVGCHGKCAKYIEWKSENDGNNRQRKLDNQPVTPRLRFNY